MSKHIKSYASAILQSTGRTMYGVDEMVRLCLVALYTGGHVLLEGNPGLGKTELVKTLGRVLQLPFGRIQFTPDLMPSDITGTLMPDPEDRGRLSFQRGPIFTNLLLADEINRATPKTQSAMLEAMAEQQVTVLGERYPLARPFMVLATQNPIDHEGTYTLPEAQADRFMFKLDMPVPGDETLRLILAKQAGASAGKERERGAIEGEGQRYLPIDEADSVKKHEELTRRIQEVVPLPSLEQHVLNLFLASNGRFGELSGLDGKQVERLRRFYDELMVYGLGPRAAVAMMLGAKAWSLMFLPEAVYAEGPALARVILPVLRHRVRLEFDWEDRYLGIIGGKPESNLLERMLADFCLAAAPKENEYYRTFEGPLRDSLAHLSPTGDER